MTDLPPPPPAPRHFHIYKSQRLVLDVTATPGPMLSTAGPPPQGAPQHPFLSGRAYDPFTEGALGELAREAPDFDTFIDEVIDDGFDIAAAISPTRTELRPPSRITADDDLVGVVWPDPGQFTTLYTAPTPGEAGFPHATLTAYDDDKADALLACLQQTDSFTELKIALQEAGFALQPQPAYHP